METTTKNKELSLAEGRITNMDDLARMSNAFAASGMFPDIKSAAMAMVKIQAGQEIGIKPFAAMTGIHIILGKPTIGAGIIASRIKASPKYDYSIKQMDDTICSIDFFEKDEYKGSSSFTIKDATRAGTKNIDKYPRNMLFARAISNGCRWFTPDVFDGPVYVKEEMEELMLDQKTEDAKFEVVKEVTNEPPAPTEEEIQKKKDEEADGIAKVKERLLLMIEAAKTKEGLEKLKSSVGSDTEILTAYDNKFKSLKK